MLRVLWRRYDSHTGVEHKGKGGQAKVDLTLDTIPAWLAGGRILPYKERARRSTAAMAVSPLAAVMAAAQPGMLASCQQGLCCQPALDGSMLCTFSTSSKAAGISMCTPCAHGS